MSYWNNSGTYENEANELNNLVPVSGKSKTFKGELWRAATQIYYDYFNNGFGNDWTRPATFIMDNIELPKDVKGVLLDNGKGNIVGSCSHTEKNMETMIDTVIERLRDIENKETNVDMWAYVSNNDYCFSECYVDDW